MSHRSPRPLGFWVVLILSTGGGCRPAQPPATRPAPPPSLEHLSESTRWVRDSAEYRAAVLQTYRLAAQRLDQRARGRTAGTWAVILDADETVISNVQYEIEREQVGQPFTPDSWAAWTARREATPLPGAAAFLFRLRELGGRIAIVTNRLQSECPDTEAVFRAHQLLYDVMLCRPDGSPSDKNPRFRAVSDGTALAGPPLEVLMFLGDNIHDFPELSQERVRKDPSALNRFGDAYFMVPNPMYGSWQ